ncbi:hypothetical protein M3Y99_00781900 [Aphelenchoides fujianensis]|nr:hypothetical protein M3Y99_00781900 [Aphelenchoides fujianensis]
MQVETPKLLPTASVQRLEQESFQKARDQLRAKRPEESEQPPPRSQDDREPRDCAEQNQRSARRTVSGSTTFPRRRTGRRPAVSAVGRRARTRAAATIEEATNNAAAPPRAPAPIVTRFGVVDPIVVRGNAHNDTARPFESPDRSSPNWTLNRSNPTGDSSFTAGGLGMLSSKDEIWVVLDPELFLFARLLLFELFNNLNSRLRARVLRFKWHECIRQGLEKQANEAPVGSFLKTRAAQFNRLVTAESGRLIDAMPQHLCDHPQRSAKKYLICCMNLQRQRPNARFIFLSTVITPLADAGPNFLANKIELYDPDEFTRDLESV